MVPGVRHEYTEHVVKESTLVRDLRSGRSHHDVGRVASEYPVKHVDPGREEENEELYTRCVTFDVLVRRAGGNNFANGVCYGEFSHSMSVVLDGSDPSMATANDLVPEKSHCTIADKNSVVLLK